MIQYPNYPRSRYRRAALSLPSRLASLALAAAGLSALALGVFVVTPAAKSGAASLLAAFRASSPLEWTSPQAMGVVAAVVTCVVMAVLLKLGTGAVLKAAVTQERHRVASASELYAGPGLRGHPRLEP